MSEIARSLKESITLKKTIDRLLRNLNAFDGKDALMHNYLDIVKQKVFSAAEKGFVSETYENNCFIDMVFLCCQCNHNGCLCNFICSLV